MTTTIVTRREPRVVHDHRHGHDHDHDHSHGHDHDHTQDNPGERRPTGDAVVFDIGDGIGALVVRLDEALAGTELPIESEDPTVNVHTGVWKRPVNGSDIVVAVYPELPAGRYWFPACDQHRGGDVVIISGQVAQLDLRND